MKASSSNTLWDFKLRLVEALNIHPRNAEVHIRVGDAWQKLTDDEETLAGNNDEETLAGNNDEETLAGNNGSWTLLLDPEHRPVELQMRNRDSEVLQSSTGGVEGASASNRS